MTTLDESTPKVVPQVIAIDGPAASGKSSVARELAARIGWTYVNTGNMYRAATLAVILAEADPTDEAAVLEVIDRTKFTCPVQEGRSVILVNGADVEGELNSEPVNKAVSHVARIPKVRELLLDLQRGLGLAQPAVMEGRDIGTVIFPDAPWKFYIDASEEVRAKRRGLQGLTDSVRDRDRMDSTRKTAPLMAAADAVVVDSSEMNLAEVVAHVLALLASRSFPETGPVQAPVASA
ncbi:(d)CMP kinase [Verrucomicrobium sp. BvORR034]|jgi:cytidylate kinase|uniref:(d)CMP kinase n=1 Tax=Verrucomicrobium sp. BvORR034 TaxID=1396418 RepID=UPI000679CFA5|nr:(d)CMP kinase [Verrucomicrobium sp. BvORR034]